MTANDESAQRLDSLRTASKLLFRSGLVTVIGSGWSCGKGLPSMSKLADACATQVPLSEFFGDLDDAGISDWATFSEELSTSGDFEQTMNSVSNGSLLLQIIENVIVAAVSDAEAPAIEAIVAGEPKSTDLTRFITYLARVENPISILTTNYDRLVEYSARMAGHHVDSLFSGYPIGRLDPDASRAEQWLLKSVRGKRRTVDRMYVEVLKPHGSLDWRELSDGSVVRSDAVLGTRRSIVSPGASKLEKGYQPLFDTHRIAANRRGNGASGFLFVGYGFGDSHLQAYIEDRLNDGVPGLLLTKTLTAHARRFLESYPALFAVSESTDPGRSVLSDHEGDLEVEIQGLWSLDGYLREIHHQ